VALARNLTGGYGRGLLSGAGFPIFFAGQNFACCRQKHHLIAGDSSHASHYLGMPGIVADTHAKSGI